MTTTLQNSKKNKLLLELVKSFFTKERPKTEDFYQLDELLSMVGWEFRNGNLSKEDILGISSSLGKEFLETTLQGKGLRKPNGYAGDFLLLDRIYTNHVSTNPKYRPWDKYFQQHAAPKAVRNRKEYFKNIILEKSSKTSNLRILNVVSGSGRELLELYRELPYGNNVRTTCLEIDDEAIGYSKELNKNYLDRISYVHENIFKHSNKLKYDVVWAAGLFDYMDDQSFLMLLYRFRDWLREGGEIVVGNFNERNNPSRDFMEILGDWHITHRTEKQLLNIGKQAGFETNRIRIGREKDNVILFLHLNIS